MAGVYNVLIDFSDPVDGGVYRKGQTYPRDGVTPTEERVAYLLGNENKLGRPVIEPVEGENKQEKLPCPHCGKEYANAGTLAAHIKKEHPDAEKGENKQEE